MVLFPLCAGLMIAASPADFPRQITPVVVWTGIDTKQTKPIFARCMSPEDWYATWSGHRGDGRNEYPDWPEVDFDSHMVIAIFRDTSRFRIYQIVEEQECIRICYQPYGNQVVLFFDEERGKSMVIEGGRGEIDLDAPYPLSYAFIVLPRTGKAVVLEEDVRSLVDDPPLWKKRVTFPALLRS